LELDLENNTPDVSLPDDIFYKRDGADFDPFLSNLSNNPASSHSPSIAVTENVVHVASHDFTPEIDVFYRRSTDEGATFGPTINLSVNPGSSVFPAIAASGNIVHRAILYMWYGKIQH
jgi:hypothetical protein